MKTINDLDEPIKDNYKILKTWPLIIKDWEDVFGQVIKPMSVGVKFTFKVEEVGYEEQLGAYVYTKKKKSYKREGNMVREHLFTEFLLSLGRHIETNGECLADKPERESAHFQCITNGGEE